MVRERVKNIERSTQWVIGAACTRVLGIKGMANLMNRKKSNENVVWRVREEGDAK